MIEVGRHRPHLRQPPLRRRRAKRDGSLASLKALMLVDMIGDRDLRISRDTQLDALADRHRLGGGARGRSSTSYFLAERDADRRRPPAVPRRPACPSVDIIDLDYAPWHTAQDTLDAVSARSLQVVGDVVLAALPAIEAHLSKTLVLTGRRLGAPRPYKMLKANATLRHRKRLQPAPVRPSRHVADRASTLSTDAH